MKGSAVAARHAVARERVVIVGLQPNLLTGGEAESSKALFVTLDPLRKAAGALLAAALLVGGCAVRVPVVTTPAFPDFVFPAAPASYAESPAADEQRDAWAFLQAGDLAQAETRFAALLARDAAFFPAAAGLGWVDLARGGYRDAVEHFDAALGAATRYVPALVGRGDALLSADDVSGALASFEGALAAAPAPARVERLVGELRLRVMTERYDDALAAVAAGRLSDAEAAYADMIAASPESAFLYLELARLKQLQAETAEALVWTRRARQLEPNEPGAVLLEASLLEALGELAPAEGAYELAEALDPTDASAAGLARVRRELQLAGLPEQYRGITGAESATRGDLAALLGVRLAELLDDAAFGAPTPILTDTRDHWASPWIVEAARAGVMGVGAGNRFEPERIVRRGDLADVVAAALVLIADFDPQAARRWQSARVEFSDMSPGHLNYESATRAVAAGVLRIDGDGRFDPIRPVSGAEAIDAVERLAQLAAGLG
ncbi:MAG: S-layer homology domain-containing protein [Acidobacteria bacterium]|nr:S-layer homology domain-containing protein [Acidobacteriota bacterium]